MDQNNKRYVIQYLMSLELFWNKACASGRRLGEIIFWNTFPYIEVSKIRYTISRRCFALHLLTSPCFFVLTLNESFHTSIIEIVTIGFFCFIGIISYRIKINYRSISNTILNKAATPTTPHDSFCGVTGAKA